MNAGSPGQAPPIRVWFLAAAICCIVAAALWSMLPADWREQETPAVAARTVYTKLCERVVGSDTDARTGRRLDVLVIGDSLLAQAVGAPDWAAQHVAPYSWRECIIPMGRWEFIRPLREVIATRGVRMVVVQSSMFSTLNALHDPDPSLFEIFANAASNEVKSRLGKPTPSLPALEKVDRAPLDDSCRIAEIPANELSDALRRETTPQASREFESWLRELRHRGSIVVIIDIPRSAPIETRFHIEMAAWRRETKELADRAGVEYWQASAPTDARAYCRDQTHMSELGRAEFFPPLAARIRKVLEQGPPK